MLRRCALSILGETYRWVRENCTCDAYLPGLVRDELLMLTALDPWRETGLLTPQLPQVFATDARMEGYGAVSSPATLREIKDEARFGETKGGCVCRSDVHDDIE
eukprot:1427333-Heterocapsa_arctica.AAC.1